MSRQDKHGRKAEESIKAAAAAGVNRLRRSPTGSFFELKGSRTRGGSILGDQVKQSVVSWLEWRRDRRKLQEHAREDPKGVGEYLFVLYGASSNLCDLLWERNPTFEVFYYQFRYRYISDKMVVAAYQHEPRSKERFEAICRAYFEASLFIEPFTLGFVQGTESIPPPLKQAALADLAGYVGAHISLESNPRLKSALAEEGGGPPRELLVNRLPAATTLSWNEVMESGDPLSPGGRKTNLISRAAAHIVEDGREALSKAWVVDESPPEDVGPAGLAPSNTDLEEFVLKEGLRTTLPEREYQVVAMRLNQFTFPEIAKELRIAEGNAKKTSARARERLRDLGWGAGR